MSVYLGQDKVGISYFEKANTYVDQRSIMQDTLYTPWTRPAGWPDLDSLNLSMGGYDNFIYMTFRAGNVGDLFNCGWNLVNGSSITIDYGQIENGEFISSMGTPYTSSSDDTLLISFEESTDDMVVIKVTGQFFRFYLTDINYDGRIIKYYMQPVLERIWYIPHMYGFFNGTNENISGNGTVTLQRDKISNGGNTSLYSTYFAWYRCHNLQSLEFVNFNTSNVQNMYQMFNGCEKLETLDVSNFNTAKVTNMKSVFNGCFRIKQLDLSNWRTNALTGTGIQYMFANCFALQQIIGLENFYTNNLTSLNNLFQDCCSLEDLSGISNWNVGKVITMNSVFKDCFGIKTLDLSNWDVSKVTSIEQMFYYCYSLEHVKFPKTQTSTISGSMNSMFYYCQNLQEVDLNWIKPITSAVTNIGSLFQFCRSLVEINFPEGWDITGCVTSDSCNRIFSDCYKLERITGISNWDMSHYNYSLQRMFEYDMTLKTLDISNWCPHPTSMLETFYNCQSLEEIDLTGWHWENMTGTSLQSTFSACSSLKTVKGIGTMGTSNNTSCNATFNGCYSLVSIPDISAWNMENVTTCANMFYQCRSLQSLTISNWNLAKCTTIYNMFTYCYSLQELELTGWTLSAVTNADSIFNYMHSLVKFSGLPIGVNHRMREAWNLSEDQWVRVFTQLPTVSNKTLNMSADVINRLSSTTKAIATNKGWTLAD